MLGKDNNVRYCIQDNIWDHPEASVLDMNIGGTK